MLLVEHAVSNDEWQVLSWFVRNTVQKPGATQRRSRGEDVLDLDDSLSAVLLEEEASHYQSPSDSKPLVMDEAHPTFSIVWNMCMCFLLTIN